MIVAFAFAVLFGWTPTVDPNTGPLVSATDPSYLSCTTWTGKEWTKPTARSARTPEIESPKGYRAYAEVKVTVKNGSCENTTTLYIASGVEQPFKTVYEKLPSASDGNGIRLVGWSPSGDKLLAEVILWTYETDLGYDHVAVIYDSSEGSAKEVRALDRALTRYFGTNCEFEAGLQGWRTDEEVLTKISRTPESEEYEQHFCVKEPRTFVFNLRNKTVQTDRRAVQTAN